MGWMEEIPRGGGTGFDFPDYEGLIQPRKGPAAFWMDLTASHERDLRSMHGGCPVLSRCKWIVNKWINSFDQWKRWQCGINEMDEILPFPGMTDPPPSSYHFGPPF